MKLVTVNEEASHILQVNITEALEIAQFILNEIGEMQRTGRDTQPIEIAIFQDDTDE